MLLFCFIADARTFSLCPLVIVDISVLFLTLQVKTSQVSPMRVILAVDFSYMAFIMLRYVLCKHILLRIFIMNGCCTLSNVYSASIEGIIWFLSFILLMCCITLTHLQILNHCCSPGKNPTSSWWMILLTSCWIQFPGILLRILHPCLLGILACGTLFQWSLWFWNQSNAGLIWCIWKSSFHFYFLEQFQKK